MTTADSYALLAPWLITMAPVGELRRDHAVVVRGERIEAILPAHELATRYPSIATLNLPDQVLLPGLINMHTHSAMTLLRGLADDLPLMTWLHEHIWPAEQRWMGHEYVADGVRLACLEYLRGGITCFNDSYFFPDVAAEVTRAAGMRAVMGAPVINFPTPWAADIDGYFSRAMELHEQCRTDALIEMSFAPHAPYSVSDAAFVRMRDLAAQHDLRIHLHLLETAGEIADSVGEFGMPPLQRLQQLGLLNEQLIAVHMTAINDADIELLAETGVHVVHCPESNLKLASGFCPVWKLQQAGVNVAVGTDGAASNNDLDLLGELRTATLLAKGVSGDPQAVPAASALAMITINAAQALNMADRIGSIEPGKQADFCSIDLSDPDTQPVHEIFSHLVYATSRQQVRNVWVAGQQLLRDRQPLRLDIDQINQASSKWQQRIGAARA
ncbi:MAG: TRZ/ATZ family hydrolase [Gammaproteobacteria bacterium]|jgi:5-methylthioadenosine/S-adenosylhomocysteine deaminase|nr:TRZ/ATZ family hydrolase [Gammaproteobacteria bacterium]